MSSFYDMVKTGQFSVTFDSAFVKLKDDVSALKVQASQGTATFRTRGDIPNINGVLLATEMKKGLLVVTPGTNINISTQSAAEIIAADPTNAVVNRGYQFSIINTSTEYWCTCTLQAGTGVTLIGNIYNASNNTGNYYVIYDNVDVGTEAVTIYRL